MSNLANDSWINGRSLLFNIGVKFLYGVSLNRSLLNLLVWAIFFLCLVLSHWLELRLNIFGALLLVTKLQSSECVILFVGSRISCFQFFFTNRIHQIAFLTKVKIKAILALVPNSNYRHHLTPMTLHKLSDLLSWLDDKLNPVSFWIMTSSLNFDLVKLLASRKVAILAWAEMGAVGTYEARSNDRPHIAAYTHVISVSRESICQQG